MKSFFFLFFFDRTFLDFFGLCLELAFHDLEILSTIIARDHFKATVVWRLLFRRSYLVIIHSKNLSIVFRRFFNLELVTQVFRFIAVDCTQLRCSFLHVLFKLHEYVLNLITLHVREHFKQTVEFFSSIHLTTLFHVCKWFLHDVSLVLLCTDRIVAILVLIFLTPLPPIERIAVRWGELLTCFFWFPQPSKSENSYCTLFYLLLQYKIIKILLFSV